MTNGNIEVDVPGKRIKLPKLGWVKCKQGYDMPMLPGKLKHVTVRRTASGKYLASVVVETEVVALPLTKKMVGIDLGIKTYALMSDGQEEPNPKHFAKEERKLARLQRQLSRRQVGSRNWEKARKRVARQHEYIANLRRDFLHKLSTQVVHDNQVICLEQLRVKNLVRNHKLAKVIADAAWGEFRRQVEYKAQWYGREVIIVDTFFPSTKRCHVCGRTNPMITLNVREWQCPVCHTKHDRDQNAAQNILQEGLRLRSA